MIQFTIEGAPRTKKTSQRILRFGSFNKVVPSKQYLAWRDSALAQIRQWWREPAITAPVLVEASIYRDRALGDLLGYQQGIADMLQEAGIVKDDVLIVLWPMPADGALPLRKDTKRPRVEITIHPVTQ